jgi:hypothetical protein
MQQLIVALRQKKNRNKIKKREGKPARKGVTKEERQDMKNHD